MFSYFIFLYHYYYRGDNFRHAYARVGEIRSITPANIHLMALTATATRHTRNDVIKKLGMKHCTIITRSPHKPNITLYVKEKGDLSATLMPVFDDLKTNGTSASKRIINFTARDMRKFIQSTDFSNETWDRNSQSRLLLMLQATGLLICTQSVLKRM